MRFQFRFGTEGVMEVFEEFGQGTMDKGVEDIAK